MNVAYSWNTHASSVTQHNKVYKRTAHLADAKWTILARRSGLLGLFRCTRVQMSRIACGAERRLRCIIRTSALDAMYYDVVTIRLRLRLGLGLGFRSG